MPRSKRVISAVVADISSTSTNVSTNAVEIEAVISPVLEEKSENVMAEQAEKRDESVIDNNITNAVPVAVATKSKRGRKPKNAEALAARIVLSPDGVSSDNMSISFNENIGVSSEFDMENIENEEICDTTAVSSPKKRGRKPKGGKIVPQVLPTFNAKETKTNVILHLKCSLKDLLPSEKEDDLESFNFVKSSLTYDLLKPETSLFHKFDDADEDDDDDVDFECNNEVNFQNHVQHGQNMKEIMKKLKVLEHDMHLNNVSNKKSHCFWDTCEFEGTPTYIPKFFLKGSYHVYGCFCSPNCATAYLMKEKLDSSTKFERYHLLHLIYGKAFNYSKTFKPAPDPYHTLDKYFGTLSIQEYRALFHADRLFLIVDKPLTRVMPEIHEDNDDFIINNKIIPSNIHKIKKKTVKTTKTNIVNEKFGLSSASTL
jgi:hypothetical protein